MLVEFVWEGIVDRENVHLPSMAEREILVDCVRDCGSEGKNFIFHRRFQLRPRANRNSKRNPPPSSTTDQKSRKDHAISGAMVMAHLPPSSSFANAWWADKVHPCTEPPV
jgi:hypothetical protein